MASSGLAATFFTEEGLASSGLAATFFREEGLRRKKV